MFCAHCGHGIWHRAGKRRRYVCGNVRHATGACDAKPFDAQLTEEAVPQPPGRRVHRLRRVARRRHRAPARAARRGRARAGRDPRGSEEARPAREEARRDYRNADDDDADAARILLDEVREVERERERLDAEEHAAEAALAEQERQDAADSMLDFWNDLSMAVHERVLGADSVKEANAALRERFAAIFVSSPEGGPPRLDFVLRERERGAPLVTTALWAVDPENPDQEGIVEGWQSGLRRELRLESSPHTTTRPRSTSGNGWGPRSPGDYRRY